MTGDRQGLAGALRRHRGDAGLTQAEAAQRCGVSTSTYAAIERAQRDVRVATLRDLGRGLGFDAASAYWSDVPAAGRTIAIDGIIHRIERVETDDGHYQTVFEVADDTGRWTITQERTHPPGPLRAGERLVFRAERSEQ